MRDKTPYLLLACLLSMAQFSHADSDQELQLETKGGISVASYEGDFSFELGGRLMLDAALYREDLNPLGNGTEIRRARLEAEGTLYSDWGYELALDFTGGETEIKDAYVEYLKHWPGKLKIGHFKEPFSLEELTSSKYITFMERALPNEFAPGRNIGVAYQTYGESWSYALGIFGSGSDDDVSNEGDESFGVSTRLTFSPYHGDRRALHLGIAFSHREPDDKNEIDFDSRPESHITDVKYLNSGDIEDVKDVKRQGFEFALVHGPVSFQTEWMQVTVNREMDLDSYTFNGWYGYFSWFITGESRNYKHKRGSFGRVKPHNSSGAFEVALRVSNLNLNDEDITGGEQTNTTLGLNWHFNPKTRLMANYIVIENDEDADDDGDVMASDEPHVFQLRMQFDF